MNECEKTINRREFFRKTAASAASVSLALTATDIFEGTDVYGADMDDDLDHYDFIFARVKFIDGKNVQDHWDVRPGGDANLLEELSSVIRCKIKHIQRTNNWSPQRAAPGQLNAVVTLDEPERLKKFPFLFMTGENYYKLSLKQRLNLKEYIEQGGFLHMDDCMVDPAGDFFYRDSYEILNEIFGDGAVRDIPNEHEIFHNVYDLGAMGLPWVQAQNHGAKGVFAGERLAIFLSSTDLHCGWCDRAGATFGRGKRRKLGIHGYKEAIQMGINIIMYAMTH